jgi:hypothetical protein
LASVIESEDLAAGKTDDFGCTVVFFFPAITPFLDIFRQNKVISERINLS